MNPTMEWVNDHYYFRALDEDSAPLIWCRRCGMEVTWVTRHAVARHGDPIKVVSCARRNNPKEQLW